MRGRLADRAADLVRLDRARRVLCAHRVADLRLPGPAAVLGLSLAVSLGQWWIWALLTPVVLWLASRCPLRRGTCSTRIPLAPRDGPHRRDRQGPRRGIRPPVALRRQPVSADQQPRAADADLLGAGRRRARARRLRAKPAAGGRDAGASRTRAARSCCAPQLQPHFLFNALNAIAELVHEDPERADRMIGRLSDLLRSTLDAGRPAVRDARRRDRPGASRTSTFRKRVSATGCRFESTSRRTAGPRLVPHLLLQPIVENAIQHGVAPRAGGGDDSRSARAAPAGAPWRSRSRTMASASSSEVDAGIGISNTRARLESLYGSGRVVRLCSADRRRHVASDRICRCAVDDGKWRPAMKLRDRRRGRRAARAPAAETAAGRNRAPSRSPARPATA